MPVFLVNFASEARNSLICWFVPHDTRRIALASCFCVPAPWPPQPLRIPALIAIPAISFLPLEFMLVAFRRSFAGHAEGTQTHHEIPLCQEEKQQRRDHEEQIGCHVVVVFRAGARVE